MLPFTIVELAPALRRGELTPVDLVEQCLDRIERNDAAIEAWVSVDSEGARQQAERLTEELRSGHDRGSLHGIPIGIKDLFDVAGWPTLAGSSLRAGNRAVVDAPCIAQLRAAGAILLGKTVTTEFAGFDPSPTHNPWNPAHTPGGSSSGSAAAVALRMCVAAIGSQTGGSITRPASFCGVLGMKPSYGVISLDGVVPFSPRLDHPGPIGRSVIDVIELLAVLAKPGSDVDARFRSHEPLGNLGQPPKLGVFEDFFFERATSDVVTATRSAIETLEGCGATIERLALPNEFGQVHQMHRRIMAADAARYHAAEYECSPERFGPHIRSIIAEGRNVSAAAYDEAVACQAKFRDQMNRLAETVAAIITPSTVTAAPFTLASTGDPSFNSPWSFAGVPTVSLPCALTPAGLPCSIQLIGQADADVRLLATAAWCEAKLDFKEEPRPLVAAR